MKEKSIKDKFGRTGCGVFSLAPESVLQLHDKI